MVVSSIQPTDTTRTDAGVKTDDHDTLEEARTTGEPLAIDNATITKASEFKQLPFVLVGAALCY